MNPTDRDRTWAAPRALLAVLLLALAPGCATIAGTTTGWATGLFDAPAQVYRNNAALYDSHPEYWVFNVLIVAPLGLVLGPVAGFAKGIAMDVRAALGQSSYGEILGSYGWPSIWRPYTFHPPGRERTRMGFDESD